MTATDVLASLTPECRDLTQRVIAACNGVGMEFRPYSGARSPIEQGKLWRQSRSIGTITAQIALFQAQGCFFLADAIKSAGPQNGPQVTNAPPGMSWHNHRMACDLVLVRDGAFVWDDGPAYARFGLAVKQCQGKWGGDFSDFDHLQLPLDEPLVHFGTMKAINDALAAAWPHVLGG